MSENKRAAFVTLDGSVDIATEAVFMAQLPDPATIESIVINLKRATYIDSFALGKLIKYRREFLAAGGDPQNLILIVPKDGPIRKAFELSGLDGLFATATAPRDAVS